MMGNTEPGSVVVGLPPPKKVEFRIAVQFNYPNSRQATTFSIASHLLIFSFPKREQSELSRSHDERCFLSSYSLANGKISVFTSRWTATSALPYKGTLATGSPLSSPCRRATFTLGESSAERALLAFIFIFIFFGVTSALSRFCTPQSPHPNPSLSSLLWDMVCFTGSVQGNDERVLNACLG